MYDTKSAGCAINIYDRTHCIVLFLFGCDAKCITRTLARSFWDFIKVTKKLPDVSVYHPNLFI